MPMDFWRLFSYALIMVQFKKNNVAAKELHYQLTVLTVDFGHRMQSNIVNKLSE